MLSRIWTQLGLAERKPAEIYQFDPRGCGAEDRGGPSRTDDATRELRVPGAGHAASAAAAAAVNDDDIARPHTSEHDADVLPFAPAAARAAARRQETAELLWAAAAGVAAVVTLASAALAARRYRDRRMSTQ